MIARSAIRFSWYRFTSTFRRRWAAYLTVVLLVGLVGGLGMGAVAGARRTQSAFPSFLAASRASDLEFQPYFGNGLSLQSNLYSPSFANEIARLPYVRRVGEIVELFAAPILPDGKPYLPPPLANNEVDSLGSVNDEYYFQDRVVADQGRVPNPSHIDEFAVSSQTARLLHWHVGQVVPTAFYTFQQVTSTVNGLPKSPPFLRVDEKLVGLVSDEFAVVHDQVDAYPTAELFTPVLTEKLLNAGAAGFPGYLLSLDGGASGADLVEKELIGLLPSGTTYSFRLTSVLEGQVGRATRPESIALGAFGIIAALAALLIGGQALSRALRMNSADVYVLRALGAGPQMVVLDSVMGILGAVVAGGLLASAVCVAISPFTPVGVVRQVDPSPGFNFDWTVLAAGFAVFVVVLSVTAALLTLLVVHRQGVREDDVPGRASSRVVSSAMRAGLPPAAVAGIRFAVDRGRRRDAVPVGSALLGASLAVVVVVTTLTFGSGLTTLVSHPSLYGWNWNYAIEEAGGGNVPPVAPQLLAKDKDVASWAGFNYGNAQIDGQTVPLLLPLNIHAALAPPILSGHGLQSNNQIVLGGDTLAQLDKHIGDTVVASYGTPRDAPDYLPPTRLKVVGTTALPAVGNPGTVHVSMGIGALASNSVTSAAFQAALVNPDPNLNGPSIVVVKLRNDVSKAAGLASLQRIANTTSQVVDNDPNSGGGTFQVLSVQQPAEIVNYRTMGATPAILASALAVGAIVALTLTLVASVRRRRRDLALLKTIGFVQRQISAVVSWQSSVAAVVGIIVGVPVGIVLGRTLWGVFAHEIYAVSMPTIPTLQIFLVALGALVLANAVAFVPGRIAAKTPTASLLRSE